jgi:Uma2 family endonuclease
MSPGPGRSHQAVSRELLVMFATYLKGKPCHVYSAPFDVLFVSDSVQSDNYIETVVQPDLLVVCDASKLDAKGCKGAPDLIIEILSPATGKKDITTKFDLYQRHAVKEYWLIQPDDQTIMIFKLQENGKYGAPDRYAVGDTIPVKLLGDLLINVNDVFAEMKVLEDQ